MSAPLSVLSGDVLAYDVTVTNHGPDAAGVVLTDVLPADATFVALNNLTPKAPIEFQYPLPGQAGAVIAKHPQGAIPFESGASFEIQIVVRTAAGLSDGDTIENSVQVTSDSVDPTPGDDTAKVSTTVHPPAVFISGHVFFDVNADGVRQQTEQAAQGPSVFIDLNNNGAPDDGEPICETDTAGKYQFALASPGTYVVRETPQPTDGLIRTTPESASYTVTAPAGSSFTTLDFGYTQGNHTVPVEPVANRFAPAANANAAFVTGLYRNVLERDPDAAGLAHWTGELSAGMSRVAAANAVWNSLEHRGLEVDHFYETYLHRAADAGGRSYWSALLASTSDENAVIVAIVSGTEYLALHPSDQQFVNALYDDILMRVTDPEGVAHWEAALQQGVSRSAIAEHFLHSSAPIHYLADSFYAGYLHRKGDAAGQQYIVDGLTSGDRSADQFAVSVLASDEYFAQASAAVSP